MRTKPKNILVIIGLLLVLAFSSSAQEGDRDPLSSSYIFYLYYDNGQLLSDRDFEFPYDVVPEEFVPETVNAQYPFRGEIITFSNQVADTFVFDPRRGNPDFLQGKLSVKAPYAPNGQKAVFYDAQGNQLLTVFVSDSSFCNENGVCDINNGEDENTCPADCKGVTPLPPVTDGSAGGQNGMLMAVIYVLIIAGAGLGGWYGWKWYKSRQEPPMPQYPPANFPPQQPSNSQ